MPETAVASVRRRIRAAVLQVLYETDAVRHDYERALEDRLDALDLSEPDNAFARDVVHGVLANRDEIDKMIAKYASAWPVAQMALVDRNVLRIAIFEMMIGGDTPPKVAINEAVELAKRFGSDKAPGFVNGVLGSVMAEREEPPA
jgi:N utilization substance protein B